MNAKSINFRVGLFMLAGLILLAAMIVLFSKGISLTTKTYRIYMTTPNVGGLKKGASVLLAGVPIGRVSDIQLTEDGTQVRVTLQIFKHVKIYSDARFVIEQSGFLGDQYVCVIPGQNRGPTLKEGDHIECEAPFNLLETARNVAGFVARVDAIAKKLDQTISEIRNNLLNVQTLSNMAATIALMREAAENARELTFRIDRFLTNNSPLIQSGVSNLSYVADRLARAADTINNLAESNLPNVTNALVEIEESGRLLHEILHQVRYGHGLISALLSDTQLVNHISITTSNLAITTSNINSLGLWRVLWRPRPPKTNVLPTKITPHHYNQLRVHSP
jgi:phospholipid/cholesterol/gamma-HCH transport system substrate-binding protein